MTVSTTTAVITFNGDGATTNFSFPFACPSASDINALITDNAGNVTTLSPSLFKVTLNAPIAPNPTAIGGTVLYPLVGSPLAVGNTITLSRVLPATQLTSFANQSIIYSTAIELSLDSDVMLDQQALDTASRAFRVGPQDPTPALVPSVLARANKYVAFDANGNIIAVTIVGDSASAAAAALSASQAAASASAAASSASAASGSATSAASSASSATSSASSASASAAAIANLGTTSTPIGYLAAQNFANGHVIAMLDENLESSGNQWWLRSSSSQVYPLTVFIGGTWATGDIAKFRVAWDSTTVDVSHTVASGEGPQQIAQALSTAAFANAQYVANLFYVQAIVNRGSGVWSFDINVSYAYFIASPSILGSNQSTSVSGTITFTQVVNLLDTPGAEFILSRAVNGRNAQAGDLVGEITMYGQNGAAVGTNLQQIYVKLQGYVDSPTPTAPVGRLQFQMADPGPNNVRTAMILRRGLYLLSWNALAPAGGVNGDMGPSTINVSSAVQDTGNPGGYYVDGIKGLGPMTNYANDAAAAAGGLPINGLYRNGNVVQIRIV